MRRGRPEARHGDEAPSRSPFRFGGPVVQFRRIQRRNGNRRRHRLGMQHRAVRKPRAPCRGARRRQAEESRFRGAGSLPRFTGGNHRARPDRRKAGEEHASVQGRRQTRKDGRDRLRSAQALRASQGRSRHGGGPRRHAYRKRRCEASGSGGRGHGAPRQRAQEDRACASRNRCRERA